MAFGLTWSRQARLAFWDIVAYVAGSNRDAASNLGRRIVESITSLGQFPAPGRMAPEFDDPATREAICRAFRIVYSVDTDKRRVEIVRVWHAARGIRGL